MTEILRITTREIWEQALARGEFRSDDLAAEGFIHCSTPEQLPYVHEKFYKGQTGLIVLRIDPEKLESPLVWENPHETLKLFPHVYGPIQTSAVTDVVDVETIVEKA